MGKLAVTAAVVAGLAWISIPAAGVGIPAGASAVHEARWAAVDLDGGLPEDLIRPEGRTRWDLAGVSVSRRWVRAVEAPERDASWVVVVDRESGAGGAIRRTRYAGGAGSDAAWRWLMPRGSEELVDVAAGEPIRLTRTAGEDVEPLVVRTRRVGLGWVHLPSGPREAVLQRVQVMRQEAPGGPYSVDTVGHRWIDPRGGVVAEVWGPAAPDGISRTEVAEAAVVEEISSGTTGFRIYADEHIRPNYRVVRYGWDRGAGTPISSITPDGHSTISDLTAATSWDFSGNNPTNYPGMSDFASTQAAVTPAETSNYGECGISSVNDRRLSREDRDPEDPEAVDITLGINEREDRVADVTVWLRAAVENEGVSGVGVDAESRTCHVDEGRTPVPLWQFVHLDAAANEYYMQAGDSWSHTPFNCEQTIFTNAVITDRLYTKSCSDRGGLSGQMRGNVAAEGPVTLPSGHTFNTLVVRSLIEYCVYLGSSCSEFGNFEAVRTVVHLWEVPWIGTVARLMSTNTENSATTFTTLAATDIKYGLFPPRSIAVDAVSDTSVEISWDPGLVTGHVDGYKVYWDTDSGAGGTGTCSTGLTACTADHPGGGSCPPGETCCPTPGDTCDAYAHDSAKNPGQVAFDGTSAVVVGLDPGTEYFFTVTALSEFTDPTSLIATTYESLMYPLQVTGGSSSVPAEVGATTTGGCVLPEVAGVVGDKAGTDVRFCWDAASEPCVTGYQILGAASPEAAENFSVLVADTGPVTCWSFDPAAAYFLVTTRAGAETGPWGHFAP